MSDTDAEKIRLQMMDAEEQYRELNHFFDLLEDVISKSVMRTNQELENQSLSKADYEMTKELNVQSRRNLLSLADDRNQAGYEFNERMSFYKEELFTATEGKA